MAKAGQPAKVKRNQELIRIKDQTGISFFELGRMFKMTKQAAWAIYQRGNKNRNSHQKHQDGK